MPGKALHIAIVGYGSGGQAAALLLARDGHDIEVFEQAPRLQPVGAGFLLQPTGLSVLWELGLLDVAITHGRRIDALTGDNHRGRAVMDMRYDGLDPRLFGLGMQRAALFELLRDAWPESGRVRCGTRIVSVDEDGRRIRDESGRQHGPYDMVIAADGAGSALRSHLGAVKLDRPYPWGALWCLLPERHWPWPSELRQRYRSARRMIGMLPVGSRPGDATPRLSFFWSLPTRDFPHWMDARLDTWREEVVRLWPEVSPWLQDIIDPAQLAMASYRDTVVSRWSHGRLAALGDAAHAMSPQLGQGVNMALMDAMALRNALRTEADPEVALARYGAERRAHVAIYHFWSRWLTPLFQSERDAAAWLRDRFLQPLGKAPGGRQQMLRVLTGTQRGMFGALELPAGFLSTLAEPEVSVVQSRNCSLASSA